MAALIVAGPIAGWLLTRFSPRELVAAGLAAVGLGNLVAAVVLGAQTPYAVMVVSFLLIGAGFVVGTTVRTAIIFASVPRGLPATAAALNQASVQVGARIGLVAVTVLVTRMALDSYAGTLPALDAGQRDAAIAAFQNVLNAIGTPAIGQFAVTIGAADIDAYSAAFTEGLRWGLAMAGIVALVAAPVSWLALGRQDPLRTVFDHLDERAAETAESAPVAATG